MEKENNRTKLYQVNMEECWSTGIFFRVRNCVIILVSLLSSRKKSFLVHHSSRTRQILLQSRFSTSKETETGSYSGFRRGQISNNSLRVEKYNEHDFYSDFRLSVFESFVPLKYFQTWHNCRQFHGLLRFRSYFTEFKIKFNHCSLLHHNFFTGQKMNNIHKFSKHKVIAIG